MVDAAVHPLVAKSKSPCGKTMPGGALPAGGLAGLPCSAMNCADANVHAAPPPVNDAVMVPVPVALAPLAAVVTAAGVTETVDDAGPVPTELVAVAEHEYVTPLARPVTG